MEERGAGEGPSGRGCIVSRFLRILLVACGLIGALAMLPRAQSPQFSPTLYQEMRWRMIGPYRGGRTKAAAGVPGQPNVFYVGAVNGGVWQTTDYGRTWTPIFDDQPTGSIGAIAVAPSKPDIIYVGSGEGLQRPDLSTGDGIYKSTDGGKSWVHLGLIDGQQIPQIIVDPKNPDRLFVAVLGHPYGPNVERGIFRSTDGARTFQKVLYKDENTGGADVVFDPSNADIVYAVLWESRLGPWENGEFNGPGSGLYKSTDGGTTWRPLTRGLPTFADGLGRIGITVAPSDPKRMFATVQTGDDGWLYRSDDAGESWYRACKDPRVAGRPDDFAEVKVHPRNPDIVFTASVVTWKSIDGGKTFAGFRGAPGGDDYHRIWINPDNPDVILLASDQGAIITVNGGRTWSSWYNQPTAQFFHVSTDNSFPYRVCGGQQESGSACIASRGADGEITFREWHPVGVEEYGYVAPDPLDPNIVYGGKLSRYDRQTSETRTVAPQVLRRGEYRTVRTQPVLFSPIDPHTMYFASNVVWKTTTGGQTWVAISPDLTRKTWDVPANVGKYIGTPAARPTRRGVVYTIALSPLDINRIWAGTDDGLIHVTTDGGVTWKDVTPPDLRPWAKVSLMDASHVDPLTAYAAVNAFRLDDLRPHIYRTRDGGKTWTHITSGIPDGGAVNAVREDPRRRGLLFAGTERQVYVSFDDGDHWQSLRLNMPATSIRDLVVKDNDLVVGTHGRSFWILDDITPLRQIDAKTAEADAYLFRPAATYRVRWNTYTDTPYPPDEPAGQNPPDGAVIHYALKSAARGPVVLEILDAAGRRVRRFSSDDVPEPPIEGRNIPDYWIRPPQVLSTAPGMHRFVWDLRYPRPAVAEFSYPISAVYMNTPAEPRGPWAPPGQYTIRLTVNGHDYTQPLTVRMDPRVKTLPAGLAQQFALSMGVADSLRRTRDAPAQARGLSEQLRLLGERAARTEAPPPAGSAGDLARSIAGVDDKLRAIVGGGEVAAGAQALAPRVEMSLERVRADLAALYDILQEADAAPTGVTVAAVGDVQRDVGLVLGRWQQLKAMDLPALNQKLVQAGLAALK
jgi:photosystem II stability/assembly factor-like uncharacterized protein